MSNRLAYPGESQERFTYSRVPLAMRKDPSLNPTDILVVMFVLPWMRGTDRGWVTVDTIACGARLCERAVQCSLKRLEKAGWFTIVATKSNRTRREFTARWMSDDGFEVLAERLGINSYSPQVPRLVYVQKVTDAMRAHAGAPNVRGGLNRSIQLLPHSEHASMSESDLSHRRATESPNGETALSPPAASIPATEDARNAAAVDRGVRGLYPSRMPRGSLSGAVNAIGRLAAKCLGDEHSHAFHCGVLWRVVDGDLPGKVYVEAFRVAREETHTREGEKIERRGARFKAMIDAMELRRTDDEYAEEWADQHGIAI